jgi:uncharacterized protein (TIGR02118 family)
MSTTLIVLYPNPTDLATFERRYHDEHAGMVSEHLSQAKFRAFKVVGSPAGSPPFARVAELEFPDSATMQSALGTPGGQATAAHAVEISTGGAPIFLVCESE